MKRALANGLRKAWNHLPRSSALFKLCRMYVDFYNGDNNTDFDLNGEARSLRQILPRCSVAFDVGANVGDWAALALKANPSLQIHCFEPSSQTFKALSASGLPQNVLLNQCALGEREGEATLHLHDASNVNSLYSGGTGEMSVTTGTEIVQIDTLDAYCQRHSLSSIDYLKIDTEGHELSVLKGAQSLLSRRGIRYVQLEYSPGYLEAGVMLRDVFALMMNHGYRAFKITPKAVVRVERYESGLENFRLSNWIFISPDSRDV